MTSPPSSRLAALVASVRRTVSESAASTSPAARQAAAGGGPLPEPWPGYAAQVRDESGQLNEADVRDLEAAGASEDEVFEITVAAAVGAAGRSLDAGLAALRDGPPA